MNPLVEELRGNYAIPNGIPRKVNNLGLDQPVNLKEEATKLKYERQRLCWGMIGQKTKQEIADELGCSVDMVGRYARGYVKRMTK